MKTPSLIIALAFAAACTPQEEDRAASTEAAAPSSQAPAAAPPAEEVQPETTPPAATGSGEVTAVDPAAGTVTINHGPIEALEWPAMTMTFAASGVDIAAIKQGDKVTFDLRQTGAMEATVTSISHDPAQ